MGYRFAKADTSKPRGTWDVCWPAQRGHDGVPVIDVTRPMTVQPHEWPALPDGYDYLVIRPG